MLAHMSDDGIRPSGVVIAASPFASIPLLTLHHGLLDVRLDVLHATAAEGKIEDGTAQWSYC